MPYNINVTSEVYFVTHRKMMLHEYVTPGNIPNRCFMDNIINLYQTKKTMFNH